MAGEVIDLRDISFRSFMGSSVSPFDYTATEGTVLLSGIKFRSHRDYIDPVNIIEPSISGVNIESNVLLADPGEWI